MFHAFEKVDLFRCHRSDRSNLSFLIKTGSFDLFMHNCYTITILELFLINLVSIRGDHFEIKVSSIIKLL